jgi:outer membrane murein-binding lipoprotein Lpp
MKKLFSILTVLVLIIGLAGCVSESEIVDLETQILDLEAQISTLQEENDGLEEEKVDLEAQLQDLQELLFDNVITFTFTDIFGNKVNSTVGYDNDFEGTLFDLLDSEFEVGFTESEYGKYIYSLEELNPLNGSFIAFYKNGAMSMVGVEQATYTNGDVFDFEINWYDTTEQAVFNAINLFLDEQVDNYLTETNINYNIVLGLSVLGKLEEYITDETITTYISGLTPSSITDYFKIIMILEAADLDATSYYTALNQIVAVGGYGQTAYGLLGLDANSHSEDYSSFVTAALSDLNTNTPESLGLDSGGISLVALSNYTTETGINTLINDYATWIKDDQLESGGIMTIDFGWGTSENAASISQVILGLVANGIDPTSADYTKTNGDLVSRLTEFQTETGIFDWDLTDDIADDTTFSTPQAFLALAVYYTYSNTYTAVNPFNFN